MDPDPIKVFAANTRAPPPPPPPPVDPGNVLPDPPPPPPIPPNTLVMPVKLVFAHHRGYGIPYKASQTCESAGLRLVVVSDVPVPPAPPTPVPPTADPPAPPFPLKTAPDAKACPADPFVLVLEVPAP